MRDPVYADFGAKLADIRRRCDLAQEDLARLAGVSRGTLINLEKGRQSVPLHTFLRLAYALRVDPGELIPLDWRDAVAQRWLGDFPDGARDLGLKVVASGRRAPTAG